MPANSITFDQLESQAESTLAWTIHARGVRDGFFACIICVPLLIILEHKLFDLKRNLSPELLNKITDDQARELSEKLKQLNMRLGSLIEGIHQSNLCRFAPLSHAISRIESSYDDIDSITENIYFSNNPDFKKAVFSAIDQLNLGVEKRASVLHR